MLSLLFKKNPKMSSMMSLATSDESRFGFLDDVADQLRDQYITATMNGDQMPGVGGGLAIVASAAAFATSTTDFLKNILSTSRVLKGDLVGAVLRTSEVVTAALRTHTLAEVAEQVQSTSGNQDEHSEEVKAVLTAVGHAARFAAATAGGAAGELGTLQAILMGLSNGNKRKRETLERETWEEERNANAEADAAHSVQLVEGIEKKIVGWVRDRIHLLRPGDDGDEGRRELEAMLMRKVTGADGNDLDDLVAGALWRVGVNVGGSKRKREAERECTREGVYAAWREIIHEAKEACALGGISVLRANVSIRCPLCATGTAWQMATVFFSPTFDVFDLKELRKTTDVSEANCSNFHVHHLKECVVNHFPTRTLTEDETEFVAALRTYGTKRQLPEAMRTRFEDLLVPPTSISSPLSSHSSAPPPVTPISPITPIIPPQ